MVPIISDKSFACKTALYYFGRRSFLIWNRLILFSLKSLLWLFQVLWKEARRLMQYLGFKNCYKGTVYWDKNLHLIDNNRISTFYSRKRLFLKGKKKKPRKVLILLNDAFNSNCSMEPGFVALNLPINFKKCGYNWLLKRVVPTRPRTTDVQRRNGLHCTAENSIPIPNF